VKAWLDVLAGEGMVQSGRKWLHVRAHRKEYAVELTVASAQSFLERRRPAPLISTSVRSVAAVYGELKQLCQIDQAMHAVLLALDPAYPVEYRRQMATEAESLLNDVDVRRSVESRFLFLAFPDHSLTDLPGNSTFAQAIVKDWISHQLLLAIFEAEWRYAAVELEVEPERSEMLLGALAMSGLGGELVRSIGRASWPLSVEVPRSRWGAALREQSARPLLDWVSSLGPDDIRRRHSGTIIRFALDSSMSVLRSRPPQPFIDTLRRTCEADAPRINEMVLLTLMTAMEGSVDQEWFASLVDVHRWSGMDPLAPALRASWRLLTSRIVTDPRVDMPWVLRSLPVGYPADAELRTAVGLVLNPGRVVIEVRTSDDVDLAEHLATLGQELCLQGSD
jgi:hypothetical protein